MIRDIASQLPSNVDFFLVDQGEAEATIRHVLEKVYMPARVYLDNCEPGQACQQVGKKLYQQPESVPPFKWVPFSRAYVIKVVGDVPPDTTLQVASVVMGYDPAVVLCKINDALGSD